MDSELVARRAGDGLQFLLRRLAGLAAGIAMLTIVIGAATFATGLWVFGTASAGWWIVGGILCFGPALAATLATFRVRRIADRSPRLMDELRAFRGDATRSSVDVLLDYDTGQPVAVTARSLGGLRAELDERHKEFPGLTAAVRAITTVPKLVAMAVPGMIAAGALGTVLLLIGLLG